MARIIASLEPEEIVCGLSDILKALDFLHERCRLSHNNVSPKSLFFSRKSLSSWKLGCTQLMSSPDEETFDFVKRMIVYKQLNSTHNFLPPEDLTPEICEPIPSVKEIHRRDSFAMGCLIEQLLPDCRDTELVSKLMSVKKDLRPAVGSLLLTESLFTDCYFLAFREALIAFGSYSEDEKKNFVVNGVIEMIRSISEDLLASKVIPMLLTSRLVMLHPESSSKLHPHLFVPANMVHESVCSHLISQPLFEAHVIPVIIKLYMVRKMKLRLILLQYLAYYASLTPREVIHSVLVPQITLGLEDENDDILSATYISMSTLVQMFGGDILKDCKKKRRKIFSNDIPGSSLCTSSHAVTASMRSPSVNVRRAGRSYDSHTNANNDLQGSFGRSDEWHGDWGSSPSSSPTSVTHSERQNGHVSSTADPQSMTSNGSHELTAVPALTADRNDQTSATSIKSNRRTRAGVHNLDIKAIEIQVPEEVEDLFSEMEPRVNFPVRPAQEENSRVNSHLVDMVSKKDMFALQDIQEKEGDDGDWSNDDDEDWNGKQVDHDAGDETLAASQST